LIFDSELAPIFSMLLVFLSSAILVDLLLTVFSQRLSLSTGRLQRWFFDQFGHSGVADGIVALAFQLLSFRHRAFFVQMASFLNVGSFSRYQALQTLGGALAGAGLSVLLLAWPFENLAIGLIGTGFVIGLFPGEQKTDFGVALLCWGASLFVILVCGHHLESLIVPTNDMVPSGIFIFSLFCFLSLGFQTVLPALGGLALWATWCGFSYQWLPAAFFAYGLMTNMGFYRLLNYRRMKFAIVGLFVFQIFQIVIGGFVLLELYGMGVLSFSKGSSFVENLQAMLFSYGIYQGSSLVGLPVLVACRNLPLWNEPKHKKSVQKIIAPPHQKRVYSLHLAMLLLRQEFLKMTTLAHTLLKLGRETESTNDLVGKKLEKYMSVLERVASEIKELCFSVGKQKAYRSQIHEVMTTYRTVVQLELMIDDMSYFIRFLQLKDLGEDLERDCRYWLGLQLKIYEVFFENLTMPELQSLEPVEDLAAKALEVIDRIVRDAPVVHDHKPLSKALHRITDGNLALAGISRSLSV